VDLPAVSPQVRRLSAQVPAKREVKDREAKATANQAGRRQEPERLLQLSPDKGNRSAERKKVKGLRRQEDRNNISLIVATAPDQKFGAVLGFDRGAPRCSVQQARLAVPAIIILRSAPHSVPRL
jgi:hypothetical protein